MSEIKFIGKRIDNGEWICGYYLKLTKNLHVIFNPEEIKFLEDTPLGTEVLSETVGQYIELKDKYGVELYRGDIVKLHDKWEDESTSYSTFEIVIGSPLSVKFMRITKLPNGVKIFTDAELNYCDFKHLIKIGNIYGN